MAFNPPMAISDSEVRLIARTSDSNTFQSISEWRLHREIATAELRTNRFEIHAHRPGTTSAG